MNATVQTILQIIAGTPLWVWVLLGGLVLVGVRALRPATLSPVRLAALPVAFLLWGVERLLSTFALSATSVGGWLIALVLGIGLGRLLVARVALRADKIRGLLHLPGSPLNLVLMLLIFGVHYVFGFLKATRPGLVGDPSFVLLNLGVAGLLTGILVGRFWGLWEKYRRAAHEELA
jgi:hypothetical protein